jgi:hypothetical protein
MARMVAPETVSTSEALAPAATTAGASSSCTRAGTTSAGQSPCCYPTSPAAASSSAQARQDSVLMRLARQMEFYFSQSNLANDTYIRTLRSLNDGYAPVNIIASFSKVLSIQPHDSITAVRAAAMECSEFLELVLIDKTSGKVISRGDAESLHPDQIIEAVGPKGRQPIPDSALLSCSSHSSSMASLSTSSSEESSSSSSSSSSLATTRASNVMQNTIVLRDAPIDVQEEHVRALFDFDKCPSIEHVYLDIGNCW